MQRSAASKHRQDIDHRLVFIQTMQELRISPYGQIRWLRAYIYSRYRMCTQVFGSMDYQSWDM